MAKIIIYPDRQPSDIPLKDNLVRFIAIQGTRVIDDTISKFIEVQRNSDFKEKKLHLHRSNLPPDLDNLLYRQSRTDVLTHHCKIPQSGLINRYDDFQIEKSRPCCSLKQLMCTCFFVKKLHHRTPGRLKTPTRDVSPQDKEMQQRVRDNIIYETNVPWNEKEPYHKCFYNMTNFERLCASRCGFEHDDYFDGIRDFFFTGDTGFIPDTTIHFEQRNYDVNEFTPWRNDVGDLVFDKKRSVLFGNSIDANVKIGTFKIENFMGIDNLDVEFLWLGIANIWYCPLGQSSQGPHICHITQCDKALSGGFTTCSLTGLQIQDKIGAWQIDTDNFRKTGYDWHIFSDMNDCRGVFQNQPKHINTGISNFELNKLGDSFHEVIDDMENIQQITELEEKMKSTSSSRSMKEKADRKKIKDSLLDIGTESAVKMAHTGHFSQYNEYYKEGYFIINKILKFGKKPLKAMLINMEKMMNNGYNYIKYDPNTSSSSDGRQAPKQNKITFVMENCELSRKRLTPDSFVLMDKSSTKRQKVGTTTSTALIETDQTDVSLYNNPMKMLSDSNVFNEITATIDKQDIEKIIEFKIQELTNKSIAFWALIRARTDIGKTYPNHFNYYLFVYAFLYLLRDGLIINTDRPGVQGTIIVFFERDVFLKNALIKHMTDLKKHNIVNHGKRDPSSVYKMIKTAIQDFIDKGGDYTDIHPDIQEKLDFSLTSKEFPPSLFISLHKKKNIK